MPMKLSTLRRALSGFGHCVKDQIVAEVPDDLALCEFDCRESQCSWNEWVSCERRISKAAGELMPSIIQPEQPGTTLGVGSKRSLGEAAA